MRTNLLFACSLQMSCQGADKGSTGSGGDAGDTSSADGGTSDGGTGDGGTGDGGTSDGGGDTGAPPLGGCVDGASIDVESVAVAETGMDFSVLGALAWVTGHFNGNSVMDDGATERGSLSVTSFGEGAQVVFPMWEGEVADSGSAPLCPPAYLIPFDGTLYLGNDGEIAETFSAILRASRVDTAQFEVRIDQSDLSGNSAPKFDPDDVESTFFTTLAQYETGIWSGDAFWIGGSDGQAPVYSELVATYLFTPLEGAMRPSPTRVHSAAARPQ